MATATLTINAVNDAPVATAMTPAKFNEDTQSVLHFQYSDTESNNATSCTLSNLTNVTVTQACACAAGVCTVGVTGTQITMVQQVLVLQLMMVRIQMSATATLTINPVNDAPIANDITPAAFNEDVQSIITLSYSDVEC